MVVASTCHDQCPVIDAISLPTPQMASRGLRTLCLTYTDFPATAPGRPEDFFETSHDEDLIVNCIVGIKVCAAMYICRSTIHLLHAIVNAAEMCSQAC